MPETPNNTLLMIFTGILALAVLGQTIFIFLIYRSFHRLTDRVDSLAKDLHGKADAIAANVGSAIATIQNLAETVKTLAQRVADAGAVIQNRVSELDTFLDELTDTARLEVVRIQDVLRTATIQAQETIDMARETVLAPLKEFNAVTRAIRVAVDVLFQQRRRPSRLSAQDEEMFI